MVFQILAEIEMSRNENRLSGHHFEPVRIFYFFFSWNMVVISVNMYGVKIITKFQWENGFLWGGSMEPPYALTEVWGTFKLKPPFLCDTENGRNSRNRGVENGKWQVSFSEMIRLIFVQNLSQFGRAFNKMLGKVYLLPTFPSKCCFICLLGSYFCSLNALFGSPVRGNVCRAAILFVYTWRSVSRTLQKIP